MNISSILVKHGNELFKVDAKDEFGVFMHVDGFKIHVRQYDVNLVTGMPLRECYPLIDSLQKV
ncbi:hypothetical protein [Paraglaciecola arctica]|uniref:hypothetical protein n=1 Tax=Paraglaciecola arctica TaxID=1128911 RepID=UPI001C067C7B|nr:hypothetical protein [Paraglaciecola arctica]MBU3004037.1 hypothetical protein [Paraglaciecola arctica]